MKKAALAVLMLFAVAAAARAEGAAAEPGWKFAVIPVVHLTARGVGPFLKNLVGRLIAERPDFVVIDEDFTRGTPDDKVSLATVRAWWGKIEAAVKPLQDAGIPVVPVPGNHDFYTAPRQQAYKEAWLKDDLARAGNAELRFVFGRVPFDSALGKPVASFKKALAGCWPGEKWRLTSEGMSTLTGTRRSSSAAGRSGR